ncbi:MAG: ribosomal protein S18-alanine N-acetyltransferase [Bdellovibrionota bacterium]
MSLRPATPEDLPQVLAIETAVKAANWTEENFRAELSKPYSHFLVLTDDETDTKIAAYIVFWILFDECQILDIAVDLPFRGLGYAKKLVGQAVKEATRKGIRKVLLDVRKSNQPAIQLYQSLKFVVTHVRKNFYSDGEEAYQMALYLNEIQVEF